MRRKVKLPPLCREKAASAPGSVAGSLNVLDFEISSGARLLVLDDVSNYVDLLPRADGRLSK